MGRPASSLWKSVCFRFREEASGRCGPRRPDAESDAGPGGARRDLRGVDHGTPPRSPRRRLQSGRRGVLAERRPRLHLTVDGAGRGGHGSGRPARPVAAPRPPGRAGDGAPRRQVREPRPILRPSPAHARKRWPMSRGASRTGRPPRRPTGSRRGPTGTTQVRSTAGARSKPRSGFGPGIGPGQARRGGGRRCEGGSAILWRTRSRGPTVTRPRSVSARSPAGRADGVPFCGGGQGPFQPGHDSPRPVPSPHLEFA